MTTLKGADSEIPQPGDVAGEDVWGVYLAGDIGHVWSKEDIANLGRSGVKAVLPIVIPPGGKGADGAWWFVEDEGAQTIVRLVAEARAWGLPGGAPLCFDLEQNIVEAILAVDPSLPAKIEARIGAACSAYGYHGWTYGGKTWHDAVGAAHVCHRWLAEWPAVEPTDPQLPAGFGAWQYVGNADGGRIDRDIFAGGLEYLGADLVPFIVGQPVDPPAPPAPTGDGQPPESRDAATEPALQAEAEKTADAVTKEVAVDVPAADAVAVELEKTADAPPTPTHEAEIHDLTAKIREALALHDAAHRATADILETHLSELDTLANKESSK